MKTHRRVKFQHFVEQPSGEDMVHDIEAGFDLDESHFWHLKFFEADPKLNDRDADLAAQEAEERVRLGADADYDEADFAACDN